MSVRVSSVSVLRCVGSGLVRGPIPRPKSPTDCQINSDGKQARGPYTKSRRSYLTMNQSSTSVAVSVTSVDFEET
jgi:hypothetical protein